MTEETAVQNQEPGTAAAAPVRERPAETAAFLDSDGAARWVKTLASLPVARAQDALTRQLRALAAAELPPRERAKIAEILRERVVHLHTELARRYAGKPQPEGERETEAIDSALALWQSLWEQYSACLKPLIDGDPELSGVKAKVLQRGLFVGKQLVLVHGLARRVPPPWMWQELHAYYRLAEMLDCAVAAVTDEQLQNGVGTSCYSTYSHALLLGLADPCAMTVRQIELADRWLGQWARKLFPYARQRESEGPVILIDMDSAAGAVLAPMTPRDAPPALRFGDPGKLATSVRGRLKRLAAGANPAELHLGHDVSVEQCVALLAHLDARWSHPPRPVSPAAEGHVEIVPGGIQAAYYRVGGRTFERKEDVRTERTFHGSQHLQSLNALTHYDRGKEAAERDWPWERWEGRYEWREASLSRPSTRYAWSLEQLCVVRDDERTRLAHVSRVVRDPDRGVLLALKLWPGAPKALTLRAQTTGLGEEPPVPGFLLAEAPEDRPTLIMQPRAFTPGRVLRTVDGGIERKFRLTRLLQRGADFERVAFEGV
jgi:hypothetical protein